MKAFLGTSLLAFATVQVSCFQPQKLPDIPTLKAPVTTTGSPVSLSQLEGPRQPLNDLRSTSLWATTTDENGGVAVEGELDVDAIVKYGAALAIQMGLFTVIFVCLDKAVATLGVEVPFVVNFVFFYFCALKSRVLNPLSNSRPNPTTKEIDTADAEPQRQMPTWTPPGFVFPIVWLLLIGPLRAYTSALIYSVNGGEYASFAILSLMFHLSIGDIWNTINNVERRYGTSVLGIACVYSSAAFAAYSYYQVLPLAGELLSLKLIWLTIASSLIIRTWQLNPNPKTGEKYSLLPRKEGDAKTEFMWF